MEGPSGRPERPPQAEGLPHAAAQVAARGRYARLMVVRAVGNNRHGQQGHCPNKPKNQPSGYLPSGRPTGQNPANPEAKVSLDQLRGLVWSMLPASRNPKMVNPWYAVRGPRNHLTEPDPQFHSIT